MMAKSRPKSVKKFINNVRTELKQSGILLILVPKQRITIYGEGKCNGFFDTDKMELRCATGKPWNEWLPIMVHEYSHFQQWKDNDPTFFCEISGEDNSDMVYRWALRRENHNRKIVKLWVNKLIALELNCEKRAAKNIQKFKLPIDTKDYIRKANAYILFYNYLFIRRRWYNPKYVPYEIPEIYNNMPSHFLKKYYRISKKYIDLYDKYC